MFKILTCLLFLAGCTQKADTVTVPPDIQELPNLSILSDEEKFGIEVSEYRRYAPSEEVLIGGISGIAVDDAGKIFVADWTQRAVQVFEADGKHSNTIGRSGRGPGEFVAFPRGSTLHLHKKKLYVYDTGLDQIDVFSVPQGEFLNTIDLTKSSIKFINELRMSSPTLHSVVNEDTLIISYHDFSKVIEYPQSKGEIFNRFYLADNSGELLTNTPLEYPLPEPFDAGPLARRTLVAASDKHIFAAPTGHFLLKKYNLDGEYLSSFFHPYENAVVEEYPISSDDITSETPDTWPALDAMRIDDENNVWVSTILDVDTVKWWILSEEEVLLGSFTWPRTRNVQTIRNGIIYSLNRHEEEEEIMSYKIRFIE